MSIRALWLLFVIFATASGARAAIHGGAPLTCPFGSAFQDGCGVSPGLFFAPAIGTTQPNAAPQPSAAQWSAFARQSGQTWTANHLQTWNLAGIDYGVGPAVPLSALADIAGWNSTMIGGQTAPIATQCYYQPAAGGAESIHAYASGTTLTVTSYDGAFYSGGAGSNPLAVGMELQTGPSGVQTNTFIVASLGGGQFQLSRSQTWGSVGSPTAIVVFDMPTSIAGWPVDATTGVGDPDLLCSGATQADFAIDRWNLGPTAYQGSPVGTHDCVNLIWSTIGTAYTPNISITNDAFINGTTCSPLIGGSRYGQVTAPTLIQANFKIWNNYLWGRNQDPCCAFPANQGFGFTLQALQSNADVEFNFIYQTVANPLIFGWTTGRESSYPCSNGTAYSAPGYVEKIANNYMQNFGSLYGAGHIEVATFSSAAVSAGSAQICSLADNSNTIVWDGSMPAEGAATFFMWSNSSGILEHGEVLRNTVIANLTGGKQITGRGATWWEEFYNWHTDGASPVNHIVIDGNGTSCAGQCGSPAVGSNILGGTNNTFASSVGLQQNVGGASWNAGCNQFDNASGICQVAGNFPALTAGVVTPTASALCNGTSQATVCDSIFGLGLVSTIGSQADHGAAPAVSTTTAAASGGPFTGPTITLSGSCPTTPNNARLIDTTQASAAVGVIQSCTAGVITLYANSALSVANSDSLQLSWFAYGDMQWANNYFDGTGAADQSGTSPYSYYWEINPNNTGGGYQFGGSGGCATQVNVSGNIELTSGGSANTFSTRQTGC